MISKEQQAHEVEAALGYRHIPAELAPANRGYTAVCGRFVGMQEMAASVWNDGRAFCPACARVTLKGWNAENPP